MIKNGKLRDAKHLMARLLDNVEPHVLALLAECADILSCPNVVARPKLLALWGEHQAHPVALKIIAACAPARDEWETRVVDLPQVTSACRDSTRPSSPVGTRRSAPASRSDLRARRIRGRADQHAAAYTEHRAGVDDQPAYGPRSDAYAIDYDNAALYALRGLDCVTCWTERTRADHAPRVREGDLSDDGLCSECRDKGREGIPSLPADFTAADAVAARCTYIAARHRPATARTLLNSEWHAVGIEAKALIRAWCAANAELVNAEPPKDDPVTAACACTSTKRVRDGLCADCRELAPRSIAGPRVNSNRGRGALQPLAAMATIVA
ncbi:MAG: hypothetical protein WBA97_12085 [Actinophytocola sp.]|uniref:hypothetical protein n=1 Tax=Actinophytocola sp. TaxID=1872138 RepID=UPI003C719211